MGKYEEIRANCRRELLETIDYTRDLNDEELQDDIDRKVLRAGKEHCLTLDERCRLKKELFASIRRLDILEEFLSDNTITEIMVNGPDMVFIEKDGQLMREDVKFESKEKLSDVIQQIVAKVNRVVNEASPIADARLENGARVNVVMPPVALNGPILTIRRFPDKPIQIEDLLRLKSITEEAADFLQKLVEARFNIFISGGTGSGKTTFLNALSNFIPGEERIITIEDNAELQIRSIPNLVRLETRNANVEGCKAISIRDLIKTALRMRPEGIKIIKGKSKHNKKRFPIPGAFLQHVFGDLIPLIC